MTTTARRLAAALLLSAVVASGGRAADQADGAPRPAPGGKFSLAIIATASKEWPIITGDRITVVLTNTSTQTQQVWSDQCSWGWSRLSFEVRSPSGAIQEFRRLDRGWRKNVPKVDAIEPGQQVTLTATVTDPEQWRPILGNSPPGTTTTLRAVFSSPAITDAPIAGVWAGRIESPWLECAVTLSAPKPHEEDPVVPPHDRVGRPETLSGGAAADAPAPAPKR